MKKFFTFLSVCLLLCIITTIALAENVDIPDGSPLTEDDFLIYDDTDGWQNQLDRGPTAFAVLCNDKIGDILPDENGNDYSTSRGVKMLDKKEVVISKYGPSDTFPYYATGDVITQFLAQTGDDKAASLAELLKRTEEYYVYTFRNTEQIVFYFDADDELFFIAYLNYKGYGATLDETYPELHNGSRGDKVKQLQMRLKELGYYNSSIDGDYGKGTVAAVEAFEGANSLKITGIATTELQALLYSDEAQ